MAVVRAAHVSFLSLWLLAAVLPIGICWASVVALEEGRTEADKREMRNAGRVINGHVADGGTVKFIEDKLRNHKPEVVILGNSLSNTDILPPVLAARLGIPKGKVQRFSVPNSLAPHWYAILKNRVYANGHKPRVVIILSDLQSMLAVRPRSEASYLNLTAQLSNDEPLIDDKLDRGNYFMERVRENRGRVRERSLKMVRNASVNLFRHQEFSTQERPRDRDSLERVFSDEQVDMRLHNNVIPIFQAQGKTMHAFDPNTLPMPEEGFIPAIAELINNNDGKWVFLRPPMSPFLPPEAGDVVLPEAEVAAFELMRDLGAFYNDLRPLEMNAGHFVNLDHMNEQGARRFTEALAQLFRQEDWMGRRRGDARRRNAEIELFTSVLVEDGVLQNRPVRAAFKQDPAALPRPNRPVLQGGKDDRTYFDTNGLGAISDVFTLKHTPFAARCSPVRVLEDGKALPHHNISCKEVFEGQPGGACHIEERLYFSTTDGSDALMNGRKYRIALDPDRACEGAAWVYPGDKARLTFPMEDLRVLGRGGRALEVEAVRMMGPQSELGTVRFRLKVNGKERVNQTVPVKRLSEGPHEWKIDPSVGASAKNVELVVVNDSDHYLLLTNVVIRERPSKP